MERADLKPLPRFQRTRLNQILLRLDRSRRARERSRHNLVGQQDDVLVGLDGFRDEVLRAHRFEETLEYSPITLYR
jgi:hypothetical protein